MSSKGLCVRLKAKKSRAFCGYAEGQKRCPVCSLFINFSGSSCPCCSYKLRTKPTLPKDKKIYYNYKALLT
ncbi:MAG TPA: hypothetical protein VFG45_04585 [Candidatus Nitrosocosmicus sp.]|nr:hypothetical protein [Candidatus Nitrosocosmicus sp.]